MLRLSKKVEYGIIAIRHIASLDGRGTVTTAKEISDTYDISYELLAKVLQRLTKKGLIVSYQGVRAGISWHGMPTRYRSPRLSVRSKDLHQRLRNVFPTIRASVRSSITVRSRIHWGKSRTTSTKRLKNETFRNCLRKNDDPSGLFR